MEFYASEAAIHLTVCLAVFGALAFAAPSLADERAPGTVAVGRSLFLAPGQPDRQPTGRPPPENAEWMLVTIDLMEMDWFRRLRDADPILGPDRAQPEIIRFPESAAEQLGEPRLPRHFGDPALLPNELRIPGFDARPVLIYPDVVESVSLRPLTAEPDFEATCSVQPPTSKDGVLSVCDLMVSYPPDPEIMVRAYVFLRRPLPEFAPDIPAMADRLREIALCLDVTTTPPANPEAALAALLATNPNLTECGGRLLS